MAFLRLRFGKRKQGIISLVTLRGEKGSAKENRKPIDLSSPRCWEHAEAWLRQRTTDGPDAENVYCTAGMFRDRMSRKKENALSVLALFTENDDHPLPDDLPPWSYRVETSPGRYQTYWELDMSRDPDTAQRYITAIADHIPGVGHEAIDKARILRLPGFPNVWRNGEMVSYEVGSGAEGGYQLEDFKHILVKELAALATGPPKATTAGAGVVVDVPANSQELWRQIAPKLRPFARTIAEDSTTKSEPRFSLLKEMVRQHGAGGQAVAEVASAFMATPAYRGMYAEHGADSARKMGIDMTNAVDDVMKAAARPPRTPLRAVTAEEAAEYFAHRDAYGEDYTEPMPTGVGAMRDRRTDVASIIKKGIQPPAYLEKPVLLAGAITSVFGSPGSGKTMLTLAMILSQIRLGNAVLYLDEEMGPMLAAERLQQMGATEEELSHLHYFYGLLSSLGSLEEHGATIITYVLDENIRLVCLDSFSKALLAFGLKENAPDDCGAYMRSWMQPLSRLHGGTIMFTDHTGKADSPDGRGASSKKADYDTGWHCTAGGKMTREKMGSFRLTLTKNRLGADLPQAVVYRAGGDGAGHLSVALAEDGSTGIVIPRTTPDAEYVSTLHTMGRARFSEWFAAMGKEGDGAKNAFKHTLGKLKKADMVEQDGEHYAVTEAGCAAYGLGENEGENAIHP